MRPNYAEARRLVYDRMTADGLDRWLLDDEQRCALERFDAAEAVLEQLRIGWRLDPVQRQRMRDRLFG